MGKLFVVTGPSGAGKDSVLACAQKLGLVFDSITTTTTRAMRPGESEGNPYHFITRSVFEEKIEHGAMIEWAEVYEHLYGSTKEEVEQALTGDDVVIIKVDPQGARSFRSMMPEATTIFVQPPSLAFLEKRLVNRASDAPQVIQKRLAIAQKELSDTRSWDYVIVNDEGKLKEAGQKLIEIVEKNTRKSR